MGSIIGAAYALGLSIEEIEEKLYKFFSASNIFTIENFHFFHESLIRADDIRKTFYEFVGNKTFKDLKIPFYAVGLDLESGNEVIIKEGKLLDAVEASSAIPGIFPPVFVGEQYLVDGGLVNPTPVAYLREAGMDVVIGVHTSGNISKQYISAMVWDKYYKKPEQLKKHRAGLLEQAKKNITLMIHILLRTIEIARKINAEVSLLAGRPDLLITPYTADIGMLNFERIEEAIKSGEEATEKAIPKLLKIIKDKENG